MIPTAKLRYVERVHPYKAHTIITVLQQWWAIERAGQITPQGEWRDIPTLNEIKI